MAQKAKSEITLLKILTIFLLLTTCLKAQEQKPAAGEIKNDDIPGVSSNALWADVKDTGHLMWRGSGLQFTQKTNLYYVAMAAPALWYSFDNDKRLSNHYMRGDIPKGINLVGDMGVFLNFPFAAMGVWAYGKKYHDEKLVNFAKEYAATLYVSLAESGILSFVPVHERPNTHNLSYWEKGFRGKSSFPSGHVVPYAALFFKTLQYYGPIYSIIPAALTVMAGIHRVEDGKHYPSDVVGAIFFTAFASEGVRAANGKNHHSKFYKWWAQHDLRLSYLLPLDGGKGLAISFSY